MTEQELPMPKTRQLLKKLPRRKKGERFLADPFTQYLYERDIKVR